MFKVKATLIQFLGDEEKYPCHFQHKIGDRVNFDGERYIGRLCPSVWPLLVPKMDALWAAGPRYTPPDYYFPFWYAPPSVHDSNMKKYDGLGFKNTLKTHIEDKNHMANLKPLHAYEWPPYSHRTVAKDLTVICQDTRTAAVFLIKAYDLADKALAIPYFRRQMSILNKVLAKPGTDVNKMLNLFSQFEILNIYPALSQELLIPLLEELVLFNYVKVEDGRAFVTSKGKNKLKRFTKGLSRKDRAAMKV